MKTPRSIQTRISLIVLLFGLLTIMLNQWRNQEWLVERRLDRLEHEAEDTSSRLSGMLQHLTRKRQERTAELELTYVSLSPEVELGAVCDRHGLVRCATQLQWRNMKVLDTPLAAEWPRVMPALEHMNTVISWDNEKVNLVAVSPFFEGYGPDSKAVVLIRYNSTLAIAQMHEEALYESLRQAGVLLALTLLMWFALDELVTLRVRKLVDNLRAVGERAAMAEILSGNDELTTISREFARTMQQLSEAENLVLNAAEQERRKIGQDLHDDLCQRLSANKMMLEVLKGLLPDKSGKAARIAQQVVDDQSNSVMLVRSMAQGLCPVGLEQHGLKDALESVGHFAESSYQVKCNIECLEVHEYLTATTQELLFRIAQELVINACKHSKPSIINLSLYPEQDQVVLSVLHDGRPFGETGATKRGRGMGLHLMSQRLRTLSATLERTIEKGAMDLQIAFVRIPSDNQPSNETKSSTNDNSSSHR